MSIESTLAERGSRYGDFTDHAKIAQAIQDDMRIGAGWSRLDDVKRQALTVIADKIARILSGDPNYADNWHDIQGYAKLVEDRLPSRHVDPADVEIASAIDDSSERMQAIGQNGEMADEVYAAVDTAPKIYGLPSWSAAPEWAEWLAMDGNGEWYWYERQIRAAKCRDVWEHGSGMSGAIESAAYSPEEVRPDWRTSLQARPAN